MGVQIVFCLLQKELKNKNSNVSVKIRSRATKFPYLWSGISQHSESRSNQSSVMDCRIDLRLSVWKRNNHDDYKEQKTFRNSYHQWVATKEEQALLTFHEAGFSRDLNWIKINHDLVYEKLVNGQLQYDYVLDLVEMTESKHTVIG